MESFEPDFAEDIEVADGIELPAAALEKGRLDDVGCVTDFDVDVLVELWVIVIVVSIVATPRSNRLVEAQSQPSKLKQQYLPEPQACSPFPVTKVLLLESSKNGTPDNTNMILIRTVVTTREARGSVPIRVRAIRTIKACVTIIRYVRAWLTKAVA